MASLITDLPDELLTSIINYLDLPSEHSSAHGWSKGDVRTTLCVLAVTCKRLSGFAREFMLRDVNLATGWVSSFSPLYTTDRLRKFVRTCRERPDTVNCIRNLELQADFSATPDWGASENDKAPDLVLQMVSQSTSLSHLRLLLPGVASLQWLPSLLPGYHKGKLFARLQSLYLDCGSEAIAPVLFLSICALPSLRNIDTPSPLEFVRYPYYLDRVGYSLHWSGIYNLGIEAINIGGLSAPCVHICGLLGRMPKLQELHMSVPGPGVHIDDHDGTHHRFYRPDIPTLCEFSPAQQQLWLNPVAGTLRSLSMTDPRVLVIGHDGSLLELSNFRQLENLKLSIHFLSPSSLQDAREMTPSDSVPCAPSTDIYHLLPRSLKTLEIHYDSDQGIFYDSNHIYTAYYIEAIEGFPFSTSSRISKEKALTMMYNELWTHRINNVNGDNSVQSRLEWLLALREVRDEVLPKLTTLTVRETYAREWLWRDFDLVVQHPGVFTDEVLNIDVVLRVPKKWNPPVLQD
jgi:hypothetical protein